MAVLRSQTTRYPPFVVEFESEFASYVGRKFGLSFCNGTSSLEAALFALDVKPGDEVIVPSCTFHASLDPVINCGAELVFIDILPSNGTMDPDRIADNITEKTCGIIVTHIWGFPADMRRICAIAKERKLWVVEDCSHAHGAEVAGKKCGSFGAISFFSLQGAKPIAAGEGGIAVTDDEVYYARMSAFGHFDRHTDLIAKHGFAKHKQTGLGHKLRANPLGIRLAGVDLKHLDGLNRLKHRNLCRLTREISKLEGVRIAQALPETTPGGFYYGVYIVLDSDQYDASKFSAHLRPAICLKRYPFPLHHKLERYSDATQVALPETEKLQVQALFLGLEWLLKPQENRLSAISRALNAARR